MALFLQESGAGLTSFKQTITALGLLMTDGWRYDYFGSLRINLNTGAVSGGFNHIAILNTLTSQGLDIYGNFSATSNIATISKISYRFTDGTTITIGGALIYDDFTGLINGNVTTFGYIDSAGHGISNFWSIYSPISSLILTSDLDSFVANVMSGNDSMTGTAGADCYARIRWQ